VHRVFSSLRSSRCSQSDGQRSCVDPWQCSVSLKYDMLNNAILKIFALLFCISCIKSSQCDDYVFPGELDVTYRACGNKASCNGWPKDMRMS
jgi:hypothetical protein